MAFQPSGRASGRSIGQPLSLATSTEAPATSTGGCDTLLTRGTMAMSAATITPMTTSDRTMLATEPLA